MLRQGVHRMKKIITSVRLVLFVFAFTFVAGLAAGEDATGGDYAQVILFTPQGDVKGVRQVQARFSEQIVPFGTMTQLEPFDVSCPEKGNGRWADGKNWIYDFDRDLPAGVICQFTLKEGLVTLDGKNLVGPRTFSFSTGGPSVRTVRPPEGSEHIAEDQVFLLTLDAEATRDSILRYVSCAVEGLVEPIPVRIVEGSEREAILKTYRRIPDGRPHVLLQCTRTFPANRKVSLIWGRGVTSKGGVATTQNQVFEFKSRGPFTATFRCTREHAKSGCIPMLPMSVTFSAPVSRELARKVILRGGDKIYRPEENSDQEDTVTYLSFNGPFPENATFVVEMPKEIADDAGRALGNKARFPLTVRTGPYPPLAKFASRFGIIERKDSLLPVTVRNIEPMLRGRSLGLPDEKSLTDKPADQLPESAGQTTDGTGSVLPQKGREVMDGLKGRLRRPESDEEIIDWLRKVAVAQRQESLLKAEARARDFSMPKPAGQKAFEVVGIPLGKPGLYVVELESEILGASLLGKPRPMYVQTSALVTNLSAHLKWGRESSLVWVTSLDTAEPVKGASVTIRDCNGKSIWHGTTDGNGAAHIQGTLPSEGGLPFCQWKRRDSREQEYSEPGPLYVLAGGLFVFVRAQDDMTFVHSGWDEGIESYRFNLRGGSYGGPVAAHTVFDRTLLRAGDKVHMKHLIRKAASSGFSLLNKEELPDTVVVEHIGSEQAYEFPLTWNMEQQVAETEWAIPRDAKLGAYAVVLVNKKRGTQKRYGSDRNRWESGTFRVEEFRVPLTKASISRPKEPLIAAADLPVDLFVQYLAGGGAGGLPVKLRGQMQPKTIRFEDYDGFQWTNGPVREGVTREQENEEILDEEETDVVEGEAEPAKRKDEKLQTVELTLSPEGTARAVLKGEPRIASPREMLTELEFRDPNGEIQTVSRSIALWPASLLVGLEPDSWAFSKDKLKFKALVLDLTGKPVPGTAVKVDLFQRNVYTHRKRLVGGFYAYDHVTEVKRLTSSVCAGKTDAHGLLTCEAVSPVSGSVILQATAEDSAGGASVVNREVWVATEGEWWFDVKDTDRIDLLPEKKRYEPGDVAKLQVRMPFREATVLVTVEREGILETFVKRLSGSSPVIELPVKGNYAPNAFVSVLCVRGRVQGVKPTALVDLGKPAYKLGIAEIAVGWQAHELKVKVQSEREQYRIREKVRASIAVRKADGKPLPQRGEVAVAVVDEGLLELMPNGSWQLLEDMMKRRPYEIKTATNQMHVVGKRHYGLKALPRGGGGGRQITRELFDTLVFWQGRLFLDEKGEASVEFQLPDSLTSFRIVAVASCGVGLFGSGQTSIRSTQDLMLISGLPPMVRQGDRFKALFTARNASTQDMEIEVTAQVEGGKETKKLRTLKQALKAGEARQVGWEVNVPQGIEMQKWEVTARTKDGAASDALKISQKVVAAIPIRTIQGAILQVDGKTQMTVEQPKDAVSGFGGVRISLRPKLSETSAVADYMRQYPYGCLEQKVSKAVALRDEGMWKQIMAELPSYLDEDGLLKYFPTMERGSDVLASYVLSVAHEAGWNIPDHLRESIQKGLTSFVEGWIVRNSALPTADLTIRKIAALEALSRYAGVRPEQLSSFSIDPNLWPTSAVIDWLNLLRRTNTIPQRELRLKEAEQILRSRLNFQGTTMGFSTERGDDLWWLMVSTDLNAVKTVLAALSLPDWKEDMPRLVRGALGRQYKGKWNTTIANAWGVLSIEKFGQAFEAVPVNGRTEATLQKEREVIDWAKTPSGGSAMLKWPRGSKSLFVQHVGAGKPWLTVQSLAALPLKEPVSSGYKITKTYSPIEQRQKGLWTRGDVVRVVLDIEAQSDMTWVVVNDPIPAGSTLLGSGLARDSSLLTRDEKAKGWAWPVYQERSFEGLRSYYEYVPKGKWTLEYTVRINNEGVFQLPPTRVEALYSPEMFGEIPNQTITVRSEQ